jgi:hypothetical protein
MLLFCQRGGHPTRALPVRFFGRGTFLYNDDHGRFLLLRFNDTPDFYATTSCPLPSRYPSATLARTFGAWIQRYPKLLQQPTALHQNCLHDTPSDFNLYFWRLDSAIAPAFLYYHNFTRLCTSARITSGYAFRWITELCSSRCPNHIRLYFGGLWFWIITNVPHHRDAHTIEMRTKYSNLCSHANNSTLQ